MNANSYANPGTTGGNRESLSNELTILEPEKTPFLSSISKNTDAKATFHEVIADKLRAPRITGTREGDSGPKGGNKAVKRARFGSYLHRWFDSFGVTDVQQAVSKAGGTAGVSDEYAQAKMKAVREVKRDLEATLLSNQDTQGGTDDEMKTRGAFKWINATQTPAIPADYLAPSAQIAGSITELKEIDLTTILTSLSDQYGGSEDFQMFAGNTYCQDMDLFTVQTSAVIGGGTVTQHTYPVVVQGGETKTVSLITSIYATSMGRVHIHNDKFVNVNSSGVGNGDAAIIVNTDQWFLSMLEDLHAVDDEEDAGGESGYVKAIGGLFCTMPRGNACIYGTLA
jgi:hypothetical protein